MIKKTTLNIQHALIELNAGKPLLIEQNNSFPLLIASAENISDESIKILKNLSGSHPSIVVNKNRMGFLLNRQLDNNMFSLLFKEDLSAEVCHEISFSSKVKKTLINKFHVLSENSESTLYRLLILFKKCHLIPAIVSCSLKRNLLKSEVDSLGIYTLNSNSLNEYLNTRVGINLVVKANVPLSVCKETQVLGFKSQDGGSDHFAIVLKNAHKNKCPLIRIHSQCITGDLLGSLKCDCGSQLNTALEILAKDGGILFYLSQEGRDIGFLNKIRAYSIQGNGLDTFDANNALGFDEDQRNYFVVADMLKTLKISSIRLLTNNPDKINQLEKNGLEIKECLPIKVNIDPEAKFYIKTKKLRSGHNL